jgi:uncharacterized protein
MINVLRSFSFVCCVVWSGVVNAGQVANLYQADVTAEGSTAQWQQQALAQVLARVSGKAEISAMPQIAAELKQAAGYIKQFEAVRHVDGNRMRVLLDAAKVNQLLQQYNIAVWGALRPDILVWMVQQDASERAFVRRADQPLNKALRQAFDHAALPLLQPLYDVDDLQLLSETDVWAGFWQQINQASSRYNADVMLAVTVDRVVQNNDQLYRLTWQRQDSGRTYRDEVTAVDETVLMQAFASALATQLADQYASVMSAGSSTVVTLEVQQLTSLTDLVQVQKLLQQLVGISDVTIVRFEAASAQYRLQSNISVDGLMNALRFNPKLRLINMMDTEQTDALNMALQPVLASFVYVQP